MLRTKPAIKYFLKAGNSQLVRCWEIIRRDGTVLRFTEASVPLKLSDDELYIPQGGADASAVEKQADLTGETNRDVRGLVSDDSIRDIDLRKGLYDNANIIEHVVNRNFPWVGDVMRNEYTISELGYTSTFWRAELLGLSNLLVNANGFVYSRTCPYQLGDAQCAFVLPFETGTVGSITSKRSKFTSSDLATPPTNQYYEYGDLEFTSGNNQGIVYDVKSSSNQTGAVLITLRIKTRFDIQTSDAFQIRRGCDKSLATCRDKFSNQVNFGGFPTIPGFDRGTSTPDFA